MLIHAFAGDVLDRIKIEPLRRGARSASCSRSWRSDRAEIDEPA